MTSHILFLNHCATVSSRAKKYRNILPKSLNLRIMATNSKEGCCFSLLEYTIKDHMVSVYSSMKSNENALAPPSMPPLQVHFHEKSILSNPFAHLLFISKLVPNGFSLPLCFLVKANSDPKKLNESVFLCHLPWLLSAWWKGFLKHFVLWGFMMPSALLESLCEPVGASPPLGDAPHRSVLSPSLPYIHTQITSCTLGFCYHHVLMIPRSLF